MKVKLNICENAHLCQCLSSNCSHKEPHAETENCIRPCGLDYGYNGSKCIQYKRKEKVAKFNISHDPNMDGWFSAYCSIGGMKIRSRFKGKNNAIRGAKRFCATIGFKCEIVKEEYNV